MKNISISILDAKDKEEFLEQIIKIKEEVKNIYEDSFDLIIHFDIMDNKFVPNTGINLEYIKLAKKFGMYADVHLMVEKPIQDRYIDKAVEYGADRISIHYEIKEKEKTLEYLNKLNVEVGVVVKPNTDLYELEKYKNKFSNLLIMTVEPGFGGQKYIYEMNDKIKNARKLFEENTIQIDGGVNFENIIEPLEIGVDSFVIGSYLSKANDLYTNYLSLNIIKNIIEEERNENIEFSKNILQIVENGYGKNDILLGVRTPNMRKISKRWYKHISFDVLQKFISSDIHEFRQFAIFSLIYMLNNDNIKDVFDFVNKNIEYINNWDLTDIAGPNIFAKYLLTLDNKEAKKIIQKYMSSDKLWTKRIGIVTLLEYARKDKIDFVLDNILNVIYEEYHLYQKATGWVLRESYKKDKKKIYEFLLQKNKEKKLPKILLSYACEKMTVEEKKKIRSVN